MPSNPEALLISSILRGRDYNDAIAAGVTDEMFRGFKEEWEWLSRYYADHRRVPSKVAFLNQFPDFRVKTVDDTTHFSTQVRTAYARHMLTQTMRDCATLITDGDLTNAVALIQQSAIKIGAQMTGTQDANLTEDWQIFAKEAQARKERFEQYGMAGVPTGFYSFDERVGGLAPGTVTIVASRLGGFKSWTLMRMCTAAVMDGFTAHYSSLEMSKAEVGMRMHNFLSGAVGKQVFQALDLAQGKNFDMLEYKRFLRQLRETIKGSLTVSDTRNIGLAEIAAQIERYKPDVYYLDYLTLARIGGDGGWKAIGDFTKGLKDIAGESQCAIVGAAQLNRNAAGTKDLSGPENLAGSDQIGQDADGVIIGKKRSTTVIEYTLGKMRSHPDGWGWFARLDTERGVFEEITYEEAQDQIDIDKDRNDKSKVEFERQAKEWREKRRLAAQNSKPSVKRKPQRLTKSGR